jgi:hypothetical protein
MIDHERFLVDRNNDDVNKSKDQTLLRDYKKHVKGKKKKDKRGTLKKEKPTQRTSNKNKTFHLVLSSILLGCC